MKPRPYFKDYSTRILVKRGKKRIADHIKELRGCIDSDRHQIFLLRSELKKDKEFPFRLGFMEDHMRGCGPDCMTFVMKFDKCAFMHSSFVREQEYGMMNLNAAAGRMIHVIHDATRHHVLKALQGEFCPR